MELKTYFAQDASGNIMPGATVTVYEAGTATLATGLQDESGSPLANPFTADSSAKVAFYAPDGLYDITVVGNGRTVTIRAQFVSVDGAIVLRDDLAATGGSALVGFKQAGVGAVARTGQDKLRDVVSVKDFGAFGNDVADDYAAFAAATVQAIATGKALMIPGGTYKLGTKWEISTSKLRVVALGKVVLHFTGAGTAVAIDGGAAGGGIYDVVFGGESGIEIDGNASCSDALYVRAAHHCDINIKTRNHTGVALRMDWGVCNDLRVTCSSNEADFTTIPASGILLDQRDVGEYSAANVIHTPIIEGVAGVGIILASAKGNKFIGGTSEANGKGIEIAATSDDNEFNSVWCEANSAGDLELYGSNNVFTNFRAQSVSTNNSVEIISGEHNKFIGGYLRVANCQAGSSNTVFVGVETSNNVGLGIKGSGTYQNLFCYESDVDGDITDKVTDDIGESGQTWTPGFLGGSGAQGAVTAAVGTHCRVGKLCFVQGFMSIAKGTLSGAVSVSGFPFASRNTTNDLQYIHIAEWDNIALGAGYTTLVIRILPGATTGTLLKSGASVASAIVNAADFPSPMGIRFSGCYEVA